MHVTVEEEYAQTASPVSSLRAILEGYPLSAGIFRELVQNSDDAGASKQIFVLDQRNHAADGLYKEGLAVTQGPAFMAYNDMVLSPEDWQALSSMHDSSKSADESKIGKYGVGFRSVFNLTDSPQILSDQHLAIFDPLRRHLGSEGKKILLGHVSSVFPNQLVPFGFFMKGGVAPPFVGTVIRCPLRSVPSRISDQIVQTNVISTLFQEFMDQEMEISCLFLNNINSIEIHEISPTGDQTRLAKMVISRPDPVSTTGMFTVAVQLDRFNRVSERREWHIMQSDFSHEESINNSSTVGVLQGPRFSPEVKIAVDITRPTIRGRLFSFLPLPIFTGFPVHVHGSFGIDASRANLRRDSIGLASGSRDHTKVQWNAMLFQKFIPRTWSYLLKELVSRGLVSNIFSFWPPETSSGELGSYCSLLSGELISALLATKADVWPVYQSIEFKSLESLIVAPPIAQDGLLRALSRVGISLTRPPRYIFDHLCHSSGVRILSPEVAHGLLLENVSEITQAAEGDQRLLLEYLLSTDNVLYICGLPLIPIVNGEKVTISNGQGDVSYTMLTRSEFTIFGLCDDSAIPLHQLPPHVENIMLKLVPSSVNVQRLSVRRIVEYLSIYPNRLTLSEGKTDARAVRWLSRFWEWMIAYEHRDELFPQIRNLLLLPSTNGLKKVESALFKLRGEHPAYTMGYSAIGIPFLDINVSDSAQNLLTGYGLARSISDIPALLDSLASTSLATVSQVECESILKHLAPRLDESIGQERMQRLRNLPIFPVLTYTTTGQTSSVVTNWTAIPKGHQIRSLGSPKFVPLINGISFVCLNNIAPGMVKFLEPSHPNAMSENDLIELAVENFTTQPEHLQISLLRQLTNNRNRIFPAVITKLQSQAFVLAEDGGYHVPGDIVEPGSDIVSLYIGCPGCRPSAVGRFWPEILQCLKSLRLLRAHLTPEIAAERIEYISSRHTSDESLLIARNLLLLLGSSSMDFYQVQGISEKRWLPTNQGISNAEECRHPAVSPSAHFDKVLAVLTVLGRFTMPPSLQTALGWDKPLPIKLLIEQLNGVLNSEHDCNPVVEIIKEFGRREWSDDDFNYLEKTIRDRQWIPTTGDMLADIKSSVFKFSPTMINSGFYQIRPHLKAESLLRRLGCTDHPSTRAILEKLHALDQDSNSVDVVGTSTSLLKSLPEDISPREYAKLLIPDQDSRLRPVSKVFYNDIGEYHCLMNSDGHFIAHPLVDESLAGKLDLDRLGLRHADLRNLGPNMGQAPITTVRRTLQQYTNKQFLPEFLANAEDAEATDFKVAINLMTVNDDRNLRVLTSSMAYLCKLPSLVVYNNKQFTPKDFEGICRTSVGGKEGRPDTIGEFGQGVLTMYHFTDVAMVVSGSRVLFLDPSKKHLPFPDRASLDLSLERVQKFFKDHLIALDGLFDFNMSSPSYDGTLFVLPLRAYDSPSPPIVPDLWNPERVTSEILEPFQALAGNCLLFTNIQRISCFVRAEDIVLQWSFCADKTREVLETIYTITDIEITKSTNSVAHWKTVTTSRSRDHLPSKFQQASRFRRPPFAGLAARLDRASPDNRSFNFFSILPLSSPTSLPMHVMASFKLSSDRRQIRLDSYEELETEYNTWLLSELIPPLYLFFLEHLLNSGDKHYRLRWPTNKNDTLSNLIVKSLYSSKHLTSSVRRLFPSLYSPPRVLSPQGAVLQANEPHSIRLILSLLKPEQVVNLPSGPRELARSAGVPTVVPKFVRNEILRNPGAITSDVDFQLILDVILYLTNEKDTSILCGLSILPLEDGSFGTLDVRGVGAPYYLWKPNDQARRHNFAERNFVHPEMKITDLMKLKLNIFPLDASTIKGFVEAKLSTFPGGSNVSLAQFQWTDSFWDSWEEYVSLGLIHADIASFPLVPTNLSSSLVCLDQCKNGDVLLVGGDSQEEGHALRNSLRELRLPVVHIDGQIPCALRKILEQPAFPRLNLPNVLSAMSKTGVPIPDLFHTLVDDSKIAFANWARAQVTQISKDQISLAQTLPIWWSAGGGTRLALRPSFEIQLLPEKLTLHDAADFVADCVADDASLTHLKRHMTFDELPRRLRLPDVLDMPTLLRYKQFYQSWITHLPLSDHLSGSQPLLVPTSACIFQSPEDLFKREPLFTAVFPEDSPVFVHSEFQEYEETLVNFGLRTQERLDLTVFTACAESLDLDDPNAVPRAREVFRAYSDILPRRIDAEDRDAWGGLDDIAFIPRRMDTVRKLPGQGENGPGLEIPMAVTQLPAILSPAEFVRLKFEAVAWSQRACFEEQPSDRACVDYPTLGIPSFSIVLAHLRYLTKPFLSLDSPQHQILLNDLKEVYQYFVDNLDLLRENEELAQTTLFALRDEQLFLNIDEEGDQLNWVQGSSLAFDCNVREGSIQDVRKFLRPFEKILVAAGALKVQHPSYNAEHDTHQSDSDKVQNIWSSFNRLRKEKAFIDVEFITHAINVPNQELFAHRVFLAASSEYFSDYFRGDFVESRNISPDGLHTLEVEYSWQCVRSFLDYIYTGTKGEDLSVELLVELLHLSSYYHVMDLFDDVQGEIISRRLLRPDTVDKIKAEARVLKAVCLLEACTQYESANTEFIRRSMRISSTVA